jgi:acetyl-CoA carboxylase biotin carboxyl carrier protein
VSAGTPKPEAPDLVELIDRLEKLLNESELSEIEIEAGQTGLVLRKPTALGDVGQSVAQAASAGSADRSHGSSPGAESPPQESGAPVYKGHVIAAPLTGLFYSSPSPGAEPYVREGGQVSNGQVIGLIEAMKLFNEIKSDMPGRVIRIHAEPGALVKAKQALIEIEPT